MLALGGYNLLQVFNAILERLNGLSDEGRELARGEDKNGFF